MIKACATGLLFPTLFLAAAIASASPLDVKLGLWESTITSASSGMPPIDLSRFTPEQRARFEAAFRKQQAHGPRTRTYKSCLTREKLAHDPFADAARPGESCSTKMISQSSTHWQGREVCTGSGGRREFDVDIRARSPERTTGTTVVTLSNRGHTMKVHGSISGRWLSSDCGSVQ